MSADEVAVPTEFFDRAWQSASDQLNDEANKASAGGLPTTPHLIEGTPAPAIVELAERIEADLIVMGTRGHTGLKHVLLGSVTERTLRLAHCSVLVVKGPRKSD